MYTPRFQHKKTYATSWSVEKKAQQRPPINKHKKDRRKKAAIRTYSSTVFHTTCAHALRECSSAAQYMEITARNLKLPIHSFNGYNWFSEMSRDEIVWKECHQEVERKNTVTSSRNRSQWKIYRGLKKVAWRICRKKCYLVRKIYEKIRQITEGFKTGA